MAKTIKQIADELGISKQAVFKRIDNLGLRPKLSKIDNQLMVEKEQEKMIKSAFSEKQPSTKPSTKPSTSLQLGTVNDAVVDVLLNQSEMLKNELKIKNKQIEELNKRLEENHIRFHQVIFCKAQSSSLWNNAHSFQNCFFSITASLWSLWITVDQFPCQIK